MLIPESVARGLEEELRQRLAFRDTLAERARALRRASQDLMRRTQVVAARGTSPAPLAVEYQRLSRSARDLVLRLKGEGWRDEGVVEDALQEWVEASLLVALVRQRPLPSPRALGVHAEPYLLGLSDLVGELRRVAVSALGNGQVAEAVENLTRMETLLHFLMRFDYPRSLLSMKPKQDSARSLLERTRADVEMARYLERFSREGQQRSKRTAP